MKGNDFAIKIDKILVYHLGAKSVISHPLKAIKDKKGEFQSVKTVEISHLLNLPLLVSFKKNPLYSFAHDRGKTESRLGLINRLAFICSTHKRFSNFAVKETFTS